MKSTANPNINLNEPLTRFAWVHRLFKQHYTKTGWEMDPNIKYFSRKVYNHVRNDRDTYIALTGATGSGKSNLACTLGYLVDPNFDLKNNVIYTPTIEELKLKIRYKKAIERGETLPEGALKPYSVIVVDEAIKVLYKLEQWSGVARYMKKMINLARTENKIIIVCIPNMRDMGGTFRSEMDWWIDVFFRKKVRDKPEDSFAMGCVEAPSKNKYKTDLWNFTDNEKMYEKMVGRRKYSEINWKTNLRIFQRSKNYVGHFSFKPLPPELESVYNHFKNMHDYDSLEPVKKETIWKSRHDKMKERLGILIKHLKREKGMSFVDVSKIIDLTDSSISKMIRDLERNKLLDQEYNREPPLDLKSNSSMKVGSYQP